MHEKGTVEDAECGVRSAGVENAECRKCKTFQFQYEINK